jgi:hypothetical protein
VAQVVVQRQASVARSRPCLPVAKISPTTFLSGRGISVWFPNNTRTGRQPAGQISC